MVQKVHSFYNMIKISTLFKNLIKKIRQIKKRKIKHYIIEHACLRFCIFSILTGSTSILSL